MSDEIMNKVKEDVEEGKGGFIPFDEVDSEVIIFLKRNNYQIEAMPGQNSYWYKPNRPGAAKAKNN